MSQYMYCQHKRGRQAYSIVGPFEDDVESCILARAASKLFARYETQLSPNDSYAHLSCTRQTHRLHLYIWMREGALPPLRPYVPPFLHTCRVSKKEQEYERTAGRAPGQVTRGSDPTSTTRPREPEEPHTRKPSKSSHLGIVDERLAVARTGGKRARARVLEALDNRRLAAAVRPDDHRQGRVEFDHLSSEPGPSVL